MKTIGMIGGMSWESSALYYELINTAVKNRLSGFHNAKTIMFTVDFNEIVQFQRQGNWEEAGKLLAKAARSLELAGSDMVLICANTMHKVFDTVQNAIQIPVIHIVDAVSEQIKAANIDTVALLATAYTMEQDFYINRIKQHNIQVVVPNEQDRKQVHHIIYEELCQGKVLDESRQVFKRIIAELEREGAKGVILGCTEIPMLINNKDVSIPIFNTTEIHALKAVELALAE